MTIEEIKRRHATRVIRRGKYLATLTDDERKARDAYMGWLTMWKKRYKAVAATISAKKKFVRAQGHNNLQALKQSMSSLECLKHEAHTLLMGRAMYKAMFKPPEKVA